jgi:thymidylate kinase
MVLISGLIKSRGKSKLYGGHDFFVMDRCFLDELARVEWKLKIRIPFKSLWFRYAPAPDITFYFDIPGVTSWERMDPVDTGKEAMVEKEKTYKRLIPDYAVFTDMNVLDTNGFGIDEVTKAVFTHLRNKIKSFELT